MKKSTRNTAIEALRFFFMLQICLWHYNSCGNFMKAGYLGVEFYFLLTGIFIYKNATKSNSTCGIVEYTYNKISKFYTQYILALLVTNLVVMPKVIMSIHESGLVHEILSFISQCLILQETGIYPKTYNSPTWFFSVLIWGGALVYGLTKYWPKVSIRVIFPLIAIMFLSYCFNYGKINNLEQWGMNVFLPMTLARGICEIAIGTVIGYLIFNYLDIIKRYRSYLNVATLISTILYLFIVFDRAQDAQYVFILFPIIITSAFVEGSWLNSIFRNDIWNKLGSLSFSMFLIHISLIWSLTKPILYDNFPHSVLFLIYIITLIPFAMLLSRTATYVNKHLPKLISKSDDPLSADQNRGGVICYR